MTDLLADAVDIDHAVDHLIGLHTSGSTARQIWGEQFDLGLAWAHFDHGCGGRALDPSVQAGIDRRLARAGVPHPRSANFVGIGMAAPVIHAHGRPEQRARHLRRIFTAEDHWCQLFSEPAAGSDLANVTTTARADGCCWIVNGQKVWSHFAHRAHFGLLLARTDPDVAKHRGLTMFLLDMMLPGVDVRPLRMMTGDAHFAEVFLDEVAVPDASRLGDPGDGWRLTVAVLMNERNAVGSLGEGNKGHTPFDSVLARWHDTGRPTRLRDRVVRAAIAEQVNHWTRQRAADLSRRGTPGAESAVLRILLAEHNWAVHDLGIDLEGAAGTLMPDGYPTGDEITEPDAWDLRREFFFARGLMIGGGTLEINRNVLAERFLGLPAEPRTDRDTPWKDRAR